MVHQLQRSLHLRGRLLRMDGGESGKESRFVVYLRVVLHRTTAQRVEVGVDGEIHPAQVGEVSDDFRLRHLRQIHFFPQHLLAGKRLLRHVQLR